MKRLLFYLSLAVIALAALVQCRDCQTTPRVLAAQATSPAQAVPAAQPVPAVQPTQMTAVIPPVKGDLVIDFLGAVRGYVEPCG